MRIACGALAVAVAAATMAVGAAAAAGVATIDGKVIHPTSPESVAGVEVRLLGVRRGGETLEKSVRSGPDGRFAFPDVPAPAAFLMWAQYQGLTLPAGAVILEDADVGTTRSVTVHVYDRTDDPSGLVVSRMRWVIEREAGRYRVRQVASVENPTLKVIAPGPEAPPAVRLALIPGHGPVSIQTGHDPRVTAVKDGIVELRGPFMPGASSYPLSYDIGGPAETLTADLMLANAVESAELHVRDFGVLVDAGRLHPARPIAERDQVYLRFVGFNEDAGAVIPISIEPLPPNRPLPTPVRAFVVAALAGGLLLFVGRPITPGYSTGSEPASDDAPQAREKEALFAALGDLEHDYETGKLSGEDRERLRAELRDDALRALARDRATPEPAPSETHEPCSCGRVPHPEDRFCSACGKAL